MISDNLLKDFTVYVISSDESRSRLSVHVTQKNFREYDLMISCHDKSIAADDLFSLEHTFESNSNKIIGSYYLDHDAIGLLIQKIIKEL